MKTTLGNWCQEDFIEQLDGMTPAQMFHFLLWCKAKDVTPNATQAKRFLKDSQ